MGINSTSRDESQLVIGGGQKMSLPLFVIFLVLAGVC